MGILLGICCCSVCDVSDLRQGHVTSSRFACNFPRCSCQNTKLRPLLDGAPNFRQVEGLPVYGVAIPTVRGLRNVLDELGAANGEISGGTRSGYCRT
jgi:hypothetical protein